MLQLISKIITYLFVIIIYVFIFLIVKLVYTDIRVMSRKKAGFGDDAAYLKVINSPDTLNFPIEDRYGIKAETVIGRDPKNTVCINDPYMSARNTRIYERENAFFIEDLDSTNGTALNGEPLVDEAVELFDGDRLTIGQLHFIFIMPAKPNAIVK